MRSTVRVELMRRCRLQSPDRRSSWGLPKLK